MISILAIAIVSVSNLSKKQKENSFERIKDEAITAATDFYYSNEYLFEDTPNTIEVMNNLNHDVLVCAHTHIPCTKKYSDKLLINVGSVGKPKIGKPNPTYAIINIQDNGKVDVTFRYLDYEYKRIIKDCTMLKFPSAITSSYETGKE